MQKGLPRRQAGQALLLVLLSMAVIITVVLSVLSTTVTDISVSTKEEESLRAFSAAEAGVENVLLANIDASQDIGSANFNTTIQAGSGGLSYFAYPAALSSGEAATLWLVSHDQNGNVVCNSAAGQFCTRAREVTVCWGKPDTPSNSDTAPAVEISTYYAAVAGDLSTIAVDRVAADGGSGRNRVNRFDRANDSGCALADGAKYQFSTVVDFTGLGSGVYNRENGLQLMTVRMFYNTTEAQPVGFYISRGSGGAPQQLPSQGNSIVSVGTAGEAIRKIEVSRLFGSPPESLGVSLFSPGGIIK